MKQIQSILVVDDNEGDQVIAEVAIQEYDSGITICKAYDGQQALDLLNESVACPDIIFLDINMPGMDGHEFLEEYAKTSHNSTVVAMLTTSDQAVDKEKCMRYSFVKNYLIKPLEPADIETIAKI